MILETERLVLHTVNKNMFKALMTKQCYHKIKCKVDWPPVMVKNLIEEDLLEYRNIEELMKWSVWIMVEKKSQRIIGDIGFKGIPDFDGRVEIGYGVDTDFRRRGLCYEAAAALVDMALKDVRVECILAECLKNNTGSIAVLKKVGFDQTGENDLNYLWTINKS